MRRAFQAIRQRQEELLLLIAVSFGLVVVLRPVFHLSFWHSVAVAMPVGIAIVAAFGWWLASRRQKRSHPLATETHPDLGEVRVFADRWEAVVSGRPFPARVEVSGDSAAPSPQQLELLRSIRERYDALACAAMDTLADGLAQLHPLVSREELVLTSIWLDAAGKSFSLTFDIPSRRAEVPDGLYVDFTDFDIQEGGWVH
jgi:hypothetical protein